MPRPAGEPRGPAPTAADPCPEADDIVAFVGGGLAGAALTRMETHLDRCSTCARVAAEAARLSDDPPTSVETAVVGSAESVDARVEPATAIGRYIVLGRIGTGGMGEVYVAYDRELDRKVAVKLLKPSLDVTDAQRDALQSRLQREARAMAKLNHPNVVPVHDIGWWRSQIFIAMEYIEGGTLQSWLAERTRSWREIRDIFVTTARALAAAHAVDLVHRDFKPSNVLVDRTGRPFVADFGLATSTEDDPGVEIAGTPAYMAPEQRGGGIIDARTDQYGLCMTLFEALHGHRPSSAHAGAGDEARRPSPSNVPAWLDAAARRGLQPDPAQRFADMDALVAALEPDRRIRRRRRIAVALLAALLMIAVSGWFVVSRRPSADDIARVEQLTSAARLEADAGRFIYPPPENPDQPTAYIHLMQLEALEGAAADLGRDRAAALRSDFATSLIARADELWSTPGGDLFAIDLYAAALVFDPENRSARERAGVTPGEVVGLRRQAGELDFTTSELAAARDFAELARADGPGVEVSDGTKRPVAVAKRLARMRGRNPEPAVVAAPIDAEQPAVPTIAAAAIEPATKANPPSPSDLDAELRAAFASLRSADLAVAETRFRRVLKDQPRSHRATAGLGEVEFERGAYARAATHFEQAVALAPKRAEYRVLLGDALLKVQRWHDARRQYERGAALGSTVARKRVQQMDASVAAPAK